MTSSADKALIEVDRATADALTAQAEARGKTLSVYLREVAAAGAPAANGAATVEQFDHLLDELVAGMPPAQSLPADFSRADVYDDHD